MRRLLRPIGALTTIAMLTSCAAILYPERKGNRSGHVDVVPLVVDCLLFIPGLVPGLIAIIVDFGTGAIYTGTGGTAQVVPRHGTITMRPGDVPKGSVMALRLLDEDGAVVDVDEVHGAAAKGVPLAVDLSKAAEAHPVPTEVALWLEMQLDDEAPARYPLRMR